MIAAHHQGERGDFKVREDGGRHQDERQRQQHRDDRSCRRVQPSAVDPRPKDPLVVAEQEEEHGRARQEDARQCLHHGRDQPQWGVGDKDDPAAQITSAVKRM